MEFRRIVIGVDFSDPSVAAARWVAAHFAPKAELVLVHSIFVPQPPRMLRGKYPPSQRILDAARIGAEARLRELVPDHPNVRFDVRIGRPAETLVECAKQERADLVVVGKHGKRPGVWDWLGSTAERVILQSPVPVLVASELRDVAPKRILVALDEDDATPWALLWARHLAARFDARVTGLHATRAVPASAALAMANVGSGGIAFSPGMLEAEFQWGADRWRDRMLEAGLPAERIRSEVTFGAPESEILRAAERFGTHLIVMGQRGPAARTLLGTVVRSVLRRAPCPALVVSEPRDALLG